MLNHNLLFSINPEYERLYRRVRSALDGMTDIPAEVRRFTPDRHELAVLQALEWLLSGSREPFCRYTLLPGASRDVALIGPATFSYFAEQAAQAEQILRLDAPPARRGKRARAFRSAPGELRPHHGRNPLPHWRS